MENIFESYFEQSVIKDCNVKVYRFGDYLEDDLVLLFDKAHIGNITTILRNNYVIREYPTEQTTIEIKNWLGLSQATRDYLSQIDNILLIKYVVENDETEQARVCFINNFEITDYQQFSATIKCVSRMETMNFKSGVYKVNDFQTTNAEDMLSQVISDYQEGVQTHTDKLLDKNIEINFDDYFKSSFDPYSLSSLKNNAELYENLVIGFGCGVSMILDENIHFYVEVKDLDTRLGQAYKTLDKKNVYQLKAITKAETTKSAIFNGLKEQSTYQRLESEVLEVNGMQTPTTYTFLFPFPSNTRIDNIQAVRIDDQAIPTQLLGVYLGFGTNYAVVELSSNIYLHEGTKFTLKYSLYEIDEPKISDPQDNETTITSYIMEENENYWNIVNVLDNAKLYLSFDEMLDFECRIDPTIEPLDILYVDPYMIAVEEVKINFNGGFRGNIKGRIIHSFTDLTWLNVDFSFGVGGQYGYITLENTSNESKSFIFEVDGNSLELTMTANETKVINSNDYAWFSTLMYKMRSSGYTPIIVAYVKDGRYIVEKHDFTNDIYYPPLVYQIVYDPDDWSFKVRNLNNKVVDMVIRGSGSSSLYVREFTANELFTYTKTNYPNLTNYFQEKSTGSLDDDLYCYFVYQGEEEEVSGTTIILEEDI